MMEADFTFQELVERHFDALYNYARILTRSLAEAEDLFQETLVRALRGVKTFDRSRNIKIWLLKVMKNVYVDECRRLKRMPMIEPLDQEPRLAQHDISGDLYRAPPARPHPAPAPQASDPSPGHAGQAVQTAVAAVPRAAANHSRGPGGLRVAAGWDWDHRLTRPQRGASEALHRLADAAVEQHQRLAGGLLPLDFERASPKDAEQMVQCPPRLSRAVAGPSV